MLFQPNRDEVRRFFIDAWRKRTQTHSPSSTFTTLLSPIETLAAQWIEDHPEYHQDMNEHALERDYSIDEAKTNPFLHLAMHVSISEQVSIDQPPGVRAAIEQLSRQLGSLHAAHHQAMACLGEMLWESQRRNEAPDAERYIDCLKRSCSR